MSPFITPYYQPQSENELRHILPRKIYHAIVLQYAPIARQLNIAEFITAAAQGHAI